MKPLRIVADLRGPIVLPSGSIAIDGILAAAVAVRDHLPPPTLGVQPIEIPLQREPRGRFHLASFAVPVFDLHETRYINRRFPVPEALRLGRATTEGKARALTRVNISAGAEKTYRLPYVSSHVEGDRLEWYAIGDAEGVEALLALIHNVGKRRSVDSGRVLRWTVTECEPWGDGFPVVRDGRALRPLPIDWPGLVDPQQGYGNLTYPYWERSREELCVVPV